MLGIYENKLRQIAVGNLLAFLNAPNYKKTGAIKMAFKELIFEWHLRCSPLISI